MLDSLDAAAIRRWCEAGLEALRRHQAEINSLNVYPVDDGDTGTNLVLTVSAAWHALAVEPELAFDTEGEIARLSRVLHCMARGALLGARGSSGVIVSELLRGIAEALSQRPDARGRAVANALGAAAVAGYAAVAEPVEGTVLSVATAAAAAALAADTDDLSRVVGAAAAAASAALARTPEQLPVLAQAGVVDAGGRGLVVLLDALVDVVTGHRRGTLPLARVARDPSLLNVSREAGSDGYAYEVQYLLDASDTAVETLRGRLAEFGDALVIVGTGGVDPVPTWNVHVHVNDVGAALEAGVQAGRPHRISVTRFDDQRAASSGGAPGAGAPGGGAPGAGAPGAGAPRADAPDGAEPLPGPGDDAAPRAAVDHHARGVVVVASGDGLTQLFAAEGAVVVQGGPGNCPTPADLLAAIHMTGAGRVALLPNDASALGVGAAAAEHARAAGLKVSLVRTRSPVQGLAALAVRDSGRHFSDDVIAMAEAAAACRFAEVTVAVRAALTVAGRCEAGDILALVEGEVNLIGRDLTETCRTLLDRMLAGGGELVTLVLGADAPAHLAQQLSAHLSQRWPFVNQQVVPGGQPGYPLLVGVE